MLKKTLLAIVMLAIGAAAAVDESAAELAGPVTAKLRASEQQMVRAGVSKHDAAQLTRIVLDNNFNEPDALRAQQLVIEATAKSLPHEPVLNKAFEGVAKNIAPPKIVYAMENTYKRYDHAYGVAAQFTKNKAKAGEIGDALAKALAAGLKIEDANRVLTAFRKTTRQMPGTKAEALLLQTVMTARTAARLGVSSQTTADLACRALEQGYNTEEMAKLRTIFSNRAAHKSSQHFATRFSRAIHDGARPGDLAGGVSAGGGHGSAGSSGPGSAGGSGGSGGPGGGSGGAGGGPGGGPGGK